MNLYFWATVRNTFACVFTVANVLGTWQTYRTSAINIADPGFLKREGSILGLQAKKTKGGGVQEGVQLWAQC